MNQRQEQEWQALGDRLQNYQPAGDPATDFIAFQQLKTGNTAATGNSTLFSKLAAKSGLAPGTFTALLILCALTVTALLTFTRNSSPHQAALAQETSKTANPPARSQAPLPNRAGYETTSQSSAAYPATPAAPGQPNHKISANPPPGELSSEPRTAPPTKPTPQPRSTTTPNTFTNPSIKNEGPQTHSPFTPPRSHNSNLSPTDPAINDQAASPPVGITPPSSTPLLSGETIGPVLSTAAPATDRVNVSPTTSPVTTSDQKQHRFAFGIGWQFNPGRLGIIRLRGSTQYAFLQYQAPVSETVSLGVRVGASTYGSNNEVSDENLRKEEFVFVDPYAQAVVYEQREYIDKVMSCEIAGFGTYRLGPKVAAIAGLRLSCVIYSINLDDGGIPLQFETRTYPAGLAPFELGGLLGIDYRPHKRWGLEAVYSPDFSRGLTNLTGSLSGGRVDLTSLRGAVKFYF